MSLFRTVAVTGLCVSVGLSLFALGWSFWFLGGKEGRTSWLEGLPSLAPMAQTVGGHLVANVTVGNAPYGVQYDGGNGHVYASNEASNTVSAINGTIETATIPVGNSPVGVGYNNRNGYLYVANNGAGSVSVINNTSVVTTIGVGGYPVGVAYDSENGYMYVANGYTANTLSVINGTTVVATVPVGSFPVGVGYNSRNGYVYVANADSNSVSVINRTTVVATVPVGMYPVGVGYDNGNGYVYVTNELSSSVSVINGTSVLATIPVGSSPFGVTYDNGNGYVYVANNYSNSVSVINGTTVVATIPVGNRPVGVAYDSGNGYIYVANNGGNTVSVISTLSASASASPATVDAGQLVSFKCSSSGGVSPYTYSWTFGDGSSGVGPNPSHSYMSPGSVNAVCTATDNVRSTANSPTIVTVDSDPAVTAPLAQPSNLDIGQIVTLTALASGGSGGYVYVWLGLPMGCNSNDTNTLSCTPSATGTFHVTVGVTDSNGFTVLSGPVSLVVNQVPAIKAFTANSTSFDLGHGLTIVVSTSGGTAPLSYSYTGLPPGCSSTGTTVSCNPSSSGSYIVSVTITDQVGMSATSTVSITVDQDPKITSFNASPPGIDLGQRIVLTVSTTGGRGQNTYSYSGLPPGCSSSNVTSLSCTPSSGGTFRVAVTATDTDGMTATSYLNLTVATVLGFAPVEGYALIGGVTAAIAVAALISVILLRRQKGKQVPRPSSR